MTYKQFTDKLTHFGYKMTLHESNGVNHVSWRKFIKTDKAIIDSYISYVISNGVVRKQFSNVPNVVSICAREAYGNAGNTIDVTYQECINYIIQNELLDTDMLRDIRLNNLLK